MNDTYDDRPDETCWQIAAGFVLEMGVITLICVLAISVWMASIPRRFLRQI